ncbi:hypothetical protein G6O69_29350 [Pseudenhygromyxa sp. WMMC2535]|uniref:DUF6484 domain-containing protein n=1 Tax=Pseudenhygromyxa sp. WMMC2535 TaxID=2712867 RepID=UPI0015526DEE|nr:DUF6484 domain-containing protein [Pseudenhygromyxa sp. WMMC2535]NVB41970.1 hypothetical protein [Pseudenhygromyxa sp. WMMC2535]
MPDGSKRLTWAPAQATGLHPRLGRIVGLDAQGRALVEFSGASPRPAATLGPVPRAELERAASERREVVLAFLDGRADAPVLLSLHGPSAPEPELPEAELSEPELPEAELSEPELPEAELSEPELEIELDGEREVIEASRELVLRCGDASITLRSDGSVQIRGRDVTSWARRRQRIRGGSVNIN